MANTYGGSSKRQKYCYDNDGIEACNEFFSVTNLETNKAEWHLDTTMRFGGAWGLQGPETSTIIGEYDPQTKKFTPNENAYASTAKYFTSPEGTKKLANNIIKTNTKSAVENGKTPEEAQQQARELSKGNYAEPTQDDTNTTEIADSGIDDKPRDGTRNTFSKDLKYPESLSETQDTIKIDMLEYTAKKMNSGGKEFGAGDRRTNRDIIGTVVLPIPGGIKDADTVTWGGDNMTAIDMALANVAMESIEKGTEGFGTALGNLHASMKNTMKGGGGEIKDAITSRFTAAAIGKDFSKLMSRTQGQVMNPNMELLFGGPSLRPFSFNFLLAPRSKSESEMIMKIIRFFKQGMAPIRSGSNLFLRAPHTFQLTYRNGEQTHKYLNSFKECALKSCEVNYTPEQNYSTYEDGVMTAYTMSLQFQELEPVFNDDYGEEDVANLNFKSDETSSSTDGTSATDLGSFSDPNSILSRAAADRSSPQSDTSLTDWLN